MIDPVNLPLIQDFVNAAVELARTLQVGAERLLDHHPGARFAVGLFRRQAGAGNALHQIPVGIRRGGEIENPGRQHAAAAIESFNEIFQAPETIMIGIAAAHVVKRIGELPPDRLVF